MRYSSVTLYLRLWTLNFPFTVQQGKVIVSTGQLRNAFLFHKVFLLMLQKVHLIPVGTWKLIINCSESCSSHEILLEGYISNSKAAHCTVVELTDDTFFFFHSCSTVFSHVPSEALRPQVCYCWWSVWWETYNSQRDHNINRFTPNQRFFFWLRTKSGGEAVRAKKKSKTACNQTCKHTEVVALPLSTWLLL